MEGITVRCAQAEEYSMISALVAAVFDEFVAFAYSAAGSAEFSRFIEVDNMLRRRTDGLLLVAELDGELIGAIEARDRGHITLMFVHGKYQERGVGRLLLRGLIDRLDTEIQSVTVNAAPNSVPAYRRFGFVAAGDEQEKDGIRYVPMKARIPELRESTGDPGDGS